MTTKTKVSHPDVIGEVNRLKDVCPFGVKIRNELGELQFRELKNISIDHNGILSYTNANNESTSVSSYINEMKRLSDSRWVNHLYFKNGFGKEIKFKSFVAKRHNLHFS